MHLIRKALLEFSGTFILVFIGILTVRSNPGNLLAQALAQGLTVTVLMLCFSRGTCGMFNPALSLGLWLARLIPGVEFFTSVTAQLAGSFVSAIWCLAFVGHVAVRQATPTLASGVSGGAGFGIETALTFFLVTIALSTLTRQKDSHFLPAWGIGLTVFLGSLAGGALTGGALNPARVFGPSLASNCWDHPALYWLTSLLGGSAAGLMFRYVFLSKPTKSV
jgi:aquaporin Z